MPTPESEQLDLEDKKDLMHLLVNLPSGVSLIEANYSGSGDSGDFDDVSFLDANNQHVAVEADLAAKFGEVFDDLLCQRHGGWENQDGGFGKFTLDVPSRTLDHEHNDNFMETVLTEHHDQL